MQALAKVNVLFVNKWSCNKEWKLRSIFYYGTIALFTDEFPIFRLIKKELSRTTIFGHQAKAIILFFSVSRILQLCQRWKTNVVFVTRYLGKRNSSMSMSRSIKRVKTFNVLLVTNCLPPKLYWWTIFKWSIRYPTK